MKKITFTLRRFFPPFFCRNWSRCERNGNTINKVFSYEDHIIYNKGIYDDVCVDGFESDDKKEAFREDSKRYYDLSNQKRDLWNEMG